jgi:hypothetical protein
MKVKNKLMVILTVCVLLFITQSAAFAATTPGNVVVSASQASVTANQTVSAADQASANQTGTTTDQTIANQTGAATSQSGSVSNETGPVTDQTLIWLRPEYQGYHLLFMESIDVPASTQLPIEIKAALPKGSEISWVGEVNRSDPSKDVEAQYKVNHKANYDEVVFTLQHNMTGQIEAQWVDGLKITGDKRAINIDWTQYYPTGSVTFLFRQPDGSTDMKITPLNASLQRGPDGSSFYQSEPVALAVGEKQQLSITYNRSASATQKDMQSQSQGTGSSSNGGKDNSMFVTIFGTIVLGLVLAGLVFRTKRDSSEFDDDESDTDSDDSDPGDLNTDSSDHDEYEEDE